MSLASTIPGAMTNLLTLLQSAATAVGNLGPDATAIKVVDGMPIAFTSNYYIVLEGFSNWEQSWTTVGGDFQREEYYDLDCMIHCWHGTTDPPGRRAEAFQIMEAVRVQLYANLQLNGALPQAADVAIHQGEMVQGPADGTSGWGVDLSFKIHAENILLTP